MSPAAEILDCFGTVSYTNIDGNVLQKSINSGDTVLDIVTTYGDGRITFTSVGAEQ